MENMSVDEAKSMGAMALFGEKYGDKVRVVQFGESIELCGGTHVSSTGKIGILKIVSEGAIAAGIRRIEAFTADKAEEYINEKLDLVEEITSILKTTGNIKDSVEKLISENTILKKSIEKLQTQSAQASLKELIDKKALVNGVGFISGKIEGASPDTLKNVVWQVKDNLENTVLVVGSENDGKANLLVFVSNDILISAKINAVVIVKNIASEIKGGGGGQPFLATAGGKNPAGIESAIRKAEELLKNI
jgi:alanyl-tRNA synthetase